MKAFITSAAYIIFGFASYSYYVVQAQFSNSTITLSSNMTIDWTTHNEAHTRYCGPKTVGGYEIAKKYCSPQTACGISEATQGVYGGNGNDCSSRDYFDEEGDYSAKWMCFTDIRCLSPSNQPSAMPSGMPSKSVMPTASPSIIPTGTPSTSLVPTVDMKTKSPTKTPKTSPTKSQSVATIPETETPTGSPVEASFIKIRGHFCGPTYDGAVEGCNASKSCNSNADCNSGETCYPNISCEFMTSESNGLGDHKGVVVGADSETSKFNDGGSFGYVCGVNGALVSIGMSVALLGML